MALAMMLTAGLDGVKNNLTPPDSVDVDIFKMSAAEMQEAGITVMPGSLKEALGELKASPIAQEALGEHIFKKYIEYKEAEWDRYRTAVTDWELEEYLDIY